MRVFPALMTLVWLLCVTTPANAHGGGSPRLINAPVGPYVVSVWSIPDRPTAGQVVHFSVAVATAELGIDDRPAPGAPVLDAAVRLEMRPPNGGRPLVQPAPQATSGGELYYEGDFDVAEAGQWDVSVRVDGPAGGGEATFGLVVVTPSVNRWLYIGGAVTAVVAVGWFISRGAKAGSPVPRRPERSR